MRRSTLLLLTVMLILGLALVACSSPTTVDPTAAPTAGQTTEQDSQDVQAPAATQPPATGARTTVRWYVGLGAGSDEPTFDAQNEVVAAFNASQDHINLVLEIVDNDSAYDVLNTQIAAGNAPDIVGPMGIRGRASFPGAWLDLQPLVDRTNYDLSDFDPAMVDFYRLEGEGLLGLPFAIFPSFLYVNKGLFDEAGLPYPPQEYGARYTDENGVAKEWNIDSLRELAMKLTVDANGNDATDPDFDPNNIVQFGFGSQWTDARGRATMFGPGNLVDADGNATIPDHWRTAWNWYHQAMWQDWFHPNSPYGNSDLMGGGNWFESGNLAMAHVHLWYTCCIGGLQDEWDTAVIPSYNGVATAKMHADTFAILRASRNQEAAFEVLTYLLGPAAAKLTTVYGGMPARLSLQDEYFDNLDADRFAGENINWQAVIDGMAYADNPNHEEGMPSFLEASDRYNEFWQLLGNDPELDVEAEIERLQRDLQAIFAAAR
jgi:multiple sugar transport system substrate-binding protein